MVSVSSGNLDHIGHLDFSRFGDGSPSISVSRGCSGLHRVLTIILDVAVVLCGTMLHNTFMC